MILRERTKGELEIYKSHCISIALNVSFSVWKQLH